MTTRKKRRVLVTGATTSLGRGLVDRLLESPKVHSVLAVGRESVLGPTRSLKSDKLTYVSSDLTRARNVRRLLFGDAANMECDTLVHLAQHRRATDGGRKVHRLNVELTRQLLHLSDDHPSLKRFVFRSHAEVYRVRAEQPMIISEDHPLDLSPKAPQWVRDRVEADLTVCTRMGLSPLSITLLRTAECLGPDIGSQLYDYLNSRVCLRPAGYDPMLNVLSPEDLTRALHLAVEKPVEGIFNVAGKDTMALSAWSRCYARRDLPIPGLLLRPAYGLRARLKNHDFRYDLNHWRFHYGCVLDGARAREQLGYHPEHSLLEA